MSFFGRSSPNPGSGQRPVPPSSPYSRLPDGSQPTLPPRAPRPLPPRFDDPSGYEKRSFDQRGPPSGAPGVYVVVTFSSLQSGFSKPWHSFTVQSSPSDALALTN